MEVGQPQRVNGRSVVRLFFLMNVSNLKISTVCLPVDILYIMKEHRRVICRVSTERSDDSCAGPSLLHDDSVYCIIGWSDLAFFFLPNGCVS